MWKLYVQKLYERTFHYAWVDPDGIVRFNRVIAPVGWVSGTHPWVGVEFKTMRRVSPGWRKVNTKMTQEQLSKGWLA